MPRKLRSAAMYLVVLVVPIVTIHSEIAPPMARAQLYDSMHPTWNGASSCPQASMGTGEACRTESNAVSFFIWNGSLTDQGTINVANAISWEFHSIDLNYTWQEPVVWTKEWWQTGDVETDVIYYRNTTIPVGTLGFYWCDSLPNSPPNNNICDQGHVAFRDDTPGTDIACHETGHSVGLEHGAQAFPALSNIMTELRCMRTPIVSGDDYVGTDQAIQINQTY